jgi:hypothetical protein
MVEVQLTDHIRSAFGLVLEKKQGVTDEELAQIRTYHYHYQHKHRAHAGARRDTQGHAGTCKHTTHCTCPFT